MAVVDGSGVLVDPEGIHREELHRLASARKMISNFDRTKLSPNVRCFCIFFMSSFECFIVLCVFVCLCFV